MAISELVEDTGGIDLKPYKLRSFNAGTEITGNLIQDTRFYGGDINRNELNLNEGRFQQRNIWCVMCGYVL